MTAPTYEFGFIGTGNMGGALAQALCQTVSPDQVLLANRTAAKAEVLAGRLGCDVGGNEDVARQCRFLLLGVKPQMMADTLAPLRDILSRRADRFVLVTMAGHRNHLINAIKERANPLFYPHTTYLYDSL